MLAAIMCTFHLLCHVRAYYTDLKLKSLKTLIKFWDPSGVRPNPEDPEDRSMPLEQGGLISADGSEINN